MRAAFRLVLPLLLCLPLAAAAEESIPQAVKDAVADLFAPGREPPAIRTTEAPGLYEVMVGSAVYYLTADGKHLVRGDLFDVEKRLNLTEQRRSEQRKAALAKLDPASLITFSPSGETKHTVTVFTDVDCGYCARLHSQMQEYLDRGVEVRYAAFPRGGVDSKTYSTMVSVWCADDPRQAMTDAKAQRPVPEKTCANPVANQYALGIQTFGVSGTPTIVLENGDVIPGYMPPDKLSEAIEQRLASGKPQGG